MTVTQQIEALRLDAVRDRTGQYDLLRSVPKVVRVVPVKRPNPPVSIRKYGLSNKDYWAIQDRQNNRCAICGAQPTKYRLHLDHCHDTNKIRGLICHGCNIAIGMIKEDSETARAIGDYLDKHNGNAHVGIESASPTQKIIENNC